MCTAQLIFNKDAKNTQENDVGKVNIHNQRMKLDPFIMYKNHIKVDEGLGMVAQAYNSMYLGG